jgi:tRNA A-37 threonylcarbamoyl transferase component Bud32
MSVFVSPHDIHEPDVLFEQWWSVQGQWVEPPNQRRGGESGVQILNWPGSPSLSLYIKRQVGHTHRAILHPLGRPTILREREVYQALAALQIRTPRLIYSAARKRNGQWQALLITEALEGFISLDEWYATGACQGMNEAVIRELALTLARLHKSGWQHGCCYPKHIFVKAKSDLAGHCSVEIALLDLEKSRRRWSAKKAADKDLGQLNRHRDRIPLGDLSLLDHLHRAYLKVAG